MAREWGFRVCQPLAALNKWLQVTQRKRLVIPKCASLGHRQSKETQLYSEMLRKNTIRYVCMCVGGNSLVCCSYT